MTIRVHELARELGISSRTVLAKLSAQGDPVSTASSVVTQSVADRLRRSLGQPSNLDLGGGTHRASSWRAGAVPAPQHPDTVANVARLKATFSVAAQHQEALRALGSQFVYAASCKVRGFDECMIALVRFSGAIEAAFGLTREVLIFYSPYRDLQIRTFNAAQQTIKEYLKREITPDIMFVWAPDVRLREKLDDWSTPKTLAIPLILPENSDERDSVALISLIRDYIFSRDLFYETTPVQGERFFGRRQLLQSLRDDIRSQRVTGVFGLRKAGKTSVLSELVQTLSNSDTILILRDLESLPSPPHDPIPDLLQDLVSVLLDKLRALRLRTRELADLGDAPSILEFKRALQAILRHLALQDITIVLLLDEIEYLTPSDKIDVEEGDMTPVAQFLGALRSLVQENPNFTFLLSGLTSSIIESGRLYGRPNPLFSWAKANFLTPFDRREADDLALSVGKKMGIVIEDNALEALFDASGGHAFLYRHLASHVVQRLPIDVFQRSMSRKDVLYALEDWRRLVAGNIREMVDHVRRYYPDEAYLLDVLKTEPEDFMTIAEDVPSALGHLLGLGLIQQDGQDYNLTPVLRLL